MKLKVGYTWKSIEGLSKGKKFCITHVDAKTVTYRSETSGEIYTAERKHFEKYLERVKAHWHDTNKAYKYKKNNMRGE
jgi:hypothetical protein